MKYKNKSFKLKKSVRAITRAITFPIAAAAFISPTLVSPTFAQDSNVLEEVVVTATRRAATVQDVPINIAAVDALSLIHI